MAFEFELFHKVRNNVVAETPQIQETAQAVAMLDVLSNLAWIAFIEPDSAAIRTVVDLDVVKFQSDHSFFTGRAIHSSR